MLQLPSYLQPKEWCSINFNSAGKIQFARVTKVIFSESSVFYDVEVPISKNPEDRIITNGEIQNELGWTRIHGLSSSFVSKLESLEEESKKTPKQQIG